MTWKLINLKYAGRCNRCGVELPKGTRAVWQGRGRVICQGCVSEDGQGGTDEYQERNMQDKMMGGR